MNSGGVRRFGVTEAHDVPGPLLVPAEPSVSLVVNLSGPVAGFVTAAGRTYRSAAPAAPGPRAWATLTLSPPDAYRVLGVAPDRPVLALEDVLGTAGRDLAERLREAGDFTAMEAFLRERLASGRPPAPEVVRAWRRLAASGGRVPVRLLAEEVGWSHQHLTRMFHRQLGRPPKTLARLLRLRVALRRMREDTWQAAVAAGYFDEAHFARDLREFTGSTPGRYLREALPCGCVQSLQDGPSAAS
ncbi:helix-turn-helix domain-containing protein [Nonomuraea sp. NPDC050556]|uniref:helix-turn-helix domain-containing protein n=1 Tax=Nonomuraea sp. NPDC050556 TaxID=3364369 RepID=UPI00379F4333